MIAAAIFGAAVLAGVANAQVTATGTMGTTNPTAASLNTPINQTSYARLLSLNAIDDFCLFAPPTTGQTIGDSEAIEVAWCTKQRNNARVIPDGVFQAVHFVKTPLYWQIQGWGDFTKLNIATGDEGGELDPHGATGDGNPVGGNVTTNATGKDVSYEEWMNYMSYQQFCLRICIAENSTYSAAIMCQHTLDEMGCQWVMPGDYTNNSFTSCDGDSAFPPGVYPLANGSTSTFAQRYTGTYTAGTSVGTFTVGYTVTPQTPYSTPATSNCVTYNTIGNGIQAIATGPSVAVTTAASSSSASSRASSASTTAIGATTSAASSASTAAASAAASTSKASSAMNTFAGVNYGGTLAGVFSAVALFAGIGAAVL